MNQYKIDEAYADLLEVEYSPTKEQTKESQKLEEKLEAHIFLEEIKFFHQFSDEALFSILFPSENYVFKKYFQEYYSPNRYGKSIRYGGSNNKEKISHLKHLIGKEPEYKGKVYFSKEEFNRLKALAENLKEKYRESTELEKEFEKEFEKSKDNLMINI